jgi:hypothetical protein
VVWVLQYIFSERVVEAVLYLRPFAELVFVVEGEDVDA